MLKTKLMKEKYPNFIRQQINNPAIGNQYKIPSNLSFGKFSNIDPLDEDQYEVIKGLIHKYNNRALIKVSYRCAAHCQFCTRIRQIGLPEGDLSDEDVSRIADYIVAHSEISDVILSGGDPFYTPKKTKKLLSLLADISSVRIIRIGTRLPIHNPVSFKTLPIVDLLEVIKDIPVQDYVELDDEIETLGSNNIDIERLASEEFKEDPSSANGSSIAFILEYKNRKILLSGDAHSDLLVKSLRNLGASENNPLKLDGFKLPHHGSKYNISKELLEITNCDHYLISTNGNYFNHPEKVAMARLIKYGTAESTINFNYKTEETMIWENADWQENYKYKTNYSPDDNDGYLHLDFTI